VDSSDQNAHHAAKVGSEVTIDFGDGQPETYRLFDITTSKADLIGPALSTQTPVGRALLGHRAGETVTYQAPRGTGEVRLLTVV
jgi:transcription elongation GreA/GreB family factor